MNNKPINVLVHKEMNINNTLKLIPNSKVVEIPVIFLHEEIMKIVCKENPKVNIVYHIQRPDDGPKYLFIYTNLNKKAPYTRITVELSN